MAQGSAFTFQFDPGGSPGDGGETTCNFVADAAGIIFLCSGSSYVAANMILSTDNPKDYLIVPLYECINSLVNSDFPLALKKKKRTCLNWAWSDTPPASGGFYSVTYGHNRPDGQAIIGYDTGEDAIYIQNGLEVAKGATTDYDNMLSAICDAMVSAGQTNTADTTLHSDYGREIKVKFGIT